MAVFETPAGGVMTNEVGAITGRVEVRLAPDGAHIRYEGADEWYTVSGVPHVFDEDDAVEVLSVDRRDEFDNAIPADFKE